ncbi:MAG TPA: rhomboid family intramembrane serine protease [Aggregatilineaceae bacterium]|mgnify:CR=1 FL=1|jgi:membrane associated rhomboid family serine protease|nr:rhomboid family intramembrane serine protease [Anaerolineae bacterium]HMM27065.1 rhomboid family intramembrane serine protease [Aggregatilineaceae bacterium]
MFPIGDDNQPNRGPAILTLALVAVNVLVFLYEATLDPQQLQDFVTTYGVIPIEIQRGDDLFTLITSMFVHGGWAHIIGNMLFLWVFGDNIEHRFGGVIFLLFYLGTGLAASAAHILTNQGSTIPSVGASGALSGVLGAYLVLYPQNRVRVFVLRLGVVSVPALLFLGFWFLQQLISGVAALSVDTVQTTGVAVWAHIGGFVAGVALAIPLRLATHDAPA